ncbi:MAG: hypothetical protein D6723_12030 [Acidobacteria bacterium]|nr:MAG: hypothetical protein D6723_12030 [Acidobacteriota bacterium]
MDDSFENHRKGAENAKILQQALFIPAMWLARPWTTPSKIDDGRPMTGDRRSLFIPSVWLGRAMDDSFENHRRDAENAKILQQASSKRGGGARWRLALHLTCRGGR